MKKILVTGSAGFIGFHLYRRLTAMGYDVLGIDNLNNYYDVNLKLARLKECGFEPENIAYGRMIESPLGGRFCQLNLEDAAAMVKLFHKEKFDAVCHLAAQAGVRYSVENPSVYIQSNIDGFFNVLEGCRDNPVEHFVFASSSSIYGSSPNIPFRENDPQANPVSLYAATKKSSELMTCSYASLFGIPSTGLRFFTVYGPWGRPDMALFKFTRAVLNGTPIPLYNHGDMQRDFTYIDDIVEGVVRVLLKPLCRADQIPFRVYNIGNGHPVGLRDFVHAVERATRKTAQLDLLPLQPGDMYRTWSDTSKLKRDYDFLPSTPLELGVKNFVDWYRGFYGE